jgi:hypothetical protein
LGLQARFGVEIYRVVYQSETPEPIPQAVQVSGLILVPDSKAPVYPWISLQHGTIVGDAEAPSAAPGEGLFEASQGFITIVSDYIGYGTSTDLLHPYVIEEAYADAGVDMLRAARSLAADQGWNLGPLFLKGYSEGGYATLALQKALETVYQGEFPLVASSAGAGPYDLETTGRILLDLPQTNPVNLPFVVMSFSRWKAQGNFDPESFFEVPVSVVAPLFEGSSRSEDVFKALPTETKKIFEARIVEDFVLDEPQLPEVQLFRSWLREESLLNQAWAPSVPTRLYHCTDDETVPVAASRLTFNAFKATQADSPVTLVEIASPKPERPYRHGSCPAIFSPLQWFSEILARQPAKL